MKRLFVFFVFFLFLVPLSCDKQIIEPDSPELVIAQAPKPAQRSVIVYSGGGDVFWKDLSTGTTNNLTSGSGGGGQPDWHPSGDKIVFRRGSGTSTGPDLYLMFVSSTGTNSGVVKLGNQLGPDGHPTFSPSGDKIAWTCNPGGGKGKQICYATYNGFALGSPVVLTDNNPEPTPEYENTYRFHDSRPSWSPDGTEILFSRQCLDWPNSSPCPFKDRDLFKVNLTGKLTRVTQTPDVNEDNPSWMPITGSREIAYNVIEWTKHGTIEVEKNNIYKATMKVDSKLPGLFGIVHLKTRDTDDADYPWWSPDGTKILYTRTVNFGEANENFEVFRMPANGSKHSNLTQNDNLFEAFGKLQPVISP